jgi:hypothetical protein
MKISRGSESQIWLKEHYGRIVTTRFLRQECLLKVRCALHISTEVVVLD